MSESAIANGKGPGLGSISPANRAHYFATFTSEELKRLIEILNRHQVVMSQELGWNWLMLDSQGRLITELKRLGRGAGTSFLVSQTAIDDGNWHRIGFVWDGSCRHLYVDRVEVARDIEPLTGDLEASGGGLYFGVGNSLAPGTFFSGLIDDVRIYNRAVSP